MGGERRIEPGDHAGGTFEIGRERAREQGRGVLRGVGHQHLRSRWGKTGLMASPAWVMARWNEASFHREHLSLWSWTAIDHWRFSCRDFRYVTR